jgi:hypothetical protein
MKLIFSILVAFLTVAVHCEEKPNLFLSRILRHKGPVEIFNFELSSNTMAILNIKDLTGTFHYTGQSLNKNPKGLFLNPIGTGRLYKWKGTPTYGKWERIDSTYFTGYNFLSILFSVDSTIYNFGGTGFWYQNGNLRRYNPSSNEWTADPLNKSIPWLRDHHILFYLDTLKDVLYFNGQGRFHDAILMNDIDSTSIGKMYKLDIKNKIVTDLGKYEPIKGDFLGMTPWGTVSSFYDLADLVNNKFYKLSKNVENNLLRVLTKSISNRFAWQYSFWIDSALYFASPTKGYDSVIIHKSDLIPTNKPVYSQIKEIQKNNNPFPPILWITLLGIMFIMNIYLYIIYKKENRKNSYKLGFDETKINIATSSKSKLTELEKRLLELIFENSVLKKMTEIAEINNILGCGNKNIDVQKRLRSDAINALNEKLSLSFLTDHKIVERKRSAFDGRIFEYYIDQQYFTAIQQLLNNSTSS